MNMEVIPAIDLLNGRCVRLLQGDFLRAQEYSVDPIEYAQRLEGEGFRSLHLVDLHGARSGEFQLYDLVRRISGGSALSIQVGGGLRKREAIEEVFRAGAHRVVLGSAAMSNTAFFCEMVEEFGGERVILGADVRGALIATSGWEEQSEMTVFDLLDNLVPKGLQEVLSTAITCDGMLGGPAVELYSSLRKRYPKLEIIASGGIRSRADLQTLSGAGVRKAVVGRALLERAKGEFCW